MSASSPTSDRIRLVDALRGLALAGIAIVHFGEQYLGYMPPPEHRSYAVHGTLDGVLEAFSWILIRGKGFGLFSFLFGLSFALQMDRAAARAPGHDYRPRFAWRLAILFAIGFLHGLVYSGDILTVYALLGLALLVAHRLGDRWLLVLAAVLLVGTPRVLQRIVAGPATTQQLVADQRWLEDSARRHWRALTDGDVPAIARIHATDGFRGKWEFQFGTMGRGFQTLALFLLGLWAGRHRVLHEPREQGAFWKRLLQWSGGATVAIPVLSGVVFAAALAIRRASPATAGGAPADGGPTDPTAWPVVLGLCAFDAWNGVMTLFYVAVFVALFLKPRWQDRLLRFEPVGRMALSAYVGQTLVGSLVFFGFGLGLLGRFGNAVTLPVGAAFFALEVVACAWWLRRFRFGPLEWIWRSLTWMRRERLRAAV